MTTTPSTVEAILTTPAGDTWDALQETMSSLIDAEDDYED